MENMITYIKYGEKQTTLHQDNFFKLLVVSLLPLMSITYLIEREKKTIKFD